MKRLQRRAAYRSTGLSEMNKYLIATTIIFSPAGAAFAPPQDAQRSPSKHFAVKDTVGVCSVIDVQPSKASDLKIIGNKSGYASEKEALGALSSGCSDKINRG
jgi:hypothetical protein